MTDLNQKICDVFAGLVVRKDLVKTVKGNAIVPSYVLEYLLGQYCATNDEDSIESGIQTVKEILAKHYHLNCRRCGAIVNVSIDYQSHLDFLAASITNYKVDSHDIVFHGLCPSCQKILLGEDE